MKTKTKKTLRELMGTLTDKQIEQIVKLSDLTGTGYIPQDELIAIIRKYELIQIKKKRKKIVDKILKEN
jgi:Ca2+-binding EF-hand superfamily protein